ncbi:E3 ubiquitin-protein ligase CHFR [Entomortierella parvispora]|uniref:E3 ubiquitin-protein ligase CHFR n=1 Tax=Entomortierella parvispora TaxID=205924 RepID=A0A9P3H6Q0_9FUNG|nr:E3 ubiquitin-protein ligase CHFR [Entomortierella parvispora]
MAEDTPSTLTLEDDLSDLSQEDDIPQPVQETEKSLVTLVSLSKTTDNIELRGRKTMVGRDKKRCTEGAVLESEFVSGVHCEISSRSLTDATAVIWIKDMSSNGVWVNSKMIAKGEPTKIQHGDVIALVKPIKDKPKEPVFILTDSRSKSEFTEQQQLHAKRVADALESKEDTEANTVTSKRPKLEADEKKQKEEKEKEDSAFEKEFECGICHDIMHNALVLQPCLHSFCKECCKMCLQNSPLCPTCRQPVTKTKRDFKINNLIELFLKTRPHMARDDLEDEGAESDTSNVIVQPRNPNNGYGNDDDDDDDDEDDDDDDDDGGQFQFNGGVYGFGGLWARAPTTCPCCNPNNLNGYTCPDGVRLQELPPNATYQEYQARLQIQPGHTQCRDCRKHLPVVELPDPVARDAVADRFRCKLCRVPTCGCLTKTLDEYIQQLHPIRGFLNPAEEEIIHNYLLTERLTTGDVWQAIRTGMENGTYHYLGTAPGPAPVAAAVNPPDNNNNNNNNGDGNNNLGQAAPANANAPAAVAPAAAAVDQNNARAANVTSRDKVCFACSRNFYGNGPLYQWRKTLDPARLPPHVVARSDCWYGRECRTQHNRANPGHAQRLNHICEKRDRR